MMLLTGLLTTFTQVSVPEQGRPSRAAPALAPDQALACPGHPTSAHPPPAQAPPRQWEEIQTAHPDAEQDAILIRTLDVQMSKNEMRADPCGDVSIL